MDLGREVADDEARLWAEVRRLELETPYHSIRVTEAARGLGIHEERSRQIVRTWDNDGLVKAFSNADQVLLTSLGRGFEMPEAE